MDHRYAKETQAAERYLLGELPATEAEEFELHYFECSKCAMAVGSGGEFIEAARDIFKAERSPATVKKAESGKSSFSFPNALAAFWRQPAFGLMATAVLATVALYQGTVVIPGLRASRPLPTFQLMGLSRGTDVPVQVPAGISSISLQADIPPEAHFAAYICVFSDGSNELLRVVSPAPANGQPLAIFTDTSRLRPGKEELTIFGAGSDGKPSDKISTYLFDFEHVR